MRKRRTAFLLICTLVLAMLARCAEDSTLVVSTPEPIQASTVAKDAGTGVGANSTADVTADTGAGTGGIGAVSAAETVVENAEPHDGAEDSAWDETEAVQIALNESSIIVDGAGVTVDDNKATITAAGTYEIRGSLADGRIIIDTGDEKKVKLVLNGVDISCSTNAPIAILAADEVVVILADGSENHLSDGSSYVLSSEEDEPNAALYSKADLTITGNGSLTVQGNYNDGIASKDGLVISGGTISVAAVDDGIRGKDYVVVRDGDIEVVVQGDGLKSDNEEDAALGYVLIDGGVVDVSAGGDAIDGQTDAVVTGGEVSLSSGGGSNGRIDESTSAKGIKGMVSVVIDGGTITVSSADDAIHSNGSVTIDGGTLILASGDDGMHADTALEINGGDISITESYEGIESAAITINDGNIRIVTSDDGINVAGGADSSGMNMGPGFGGRPGVRPGGGQGPDNFAAAGNYRLTINGGYIYMDAGGDGLDSNGAIEMTGGVVIVNGPTERMNGAIDYMNGFNITGGLLVAAGSSGMAEAPSESSSQPSVLLNLSSPQRAGTLIRIQTGDGQDLLTFAPAKQYQSIAFSSPDLAASSTYQVYYGGSATGIVSDGLYQDGTYSPGIEYASFTISSMVTRVGMNIR